MKIILPLAALGILSTLFLISRTIDPTKSIPVVQIDLEQRAHDQGVTNPSFSGMTGQGDQIMFQATRARPDPDDPENLLAESIRAQMNLTSGAVIDITADNANMHQSKLTARLDGNVHMTTTTGYQINTDLLNARMDQLYVESPGAVSGMGPPGKLNAGRMLLSTDSDTSEAQLLFTDGVRLLYNPRSLKE